MRTTISNQQGFPTPRSGVENRMANGGEPARATVAETAETHQHVARFLTARAHDPDIPLDAFLPPLGVRLRPYVLVALIKADMDLQARAGYAIRVESYLDQYRDELPAGIPIVLLAEEYWLRQMHGDRPGMDEYRERFPEHYDAFEQHLGRGGSTRTPNATPVPPAGSVRGAVSVPPASDAATRATAVPSPKSNPKGSSGAIGAAAVGDVLPPDCGYKLRRRLGQGAFGRVYEAEARGGVKAAIKFVDPPASRIERKAMEAIKAFNHPYLLRTHAFWVYNDRLIIVMDLAEESLADRIKFYKERGDDGIPPDELIPFFGQAAEALDHLHSRKVAHLDVKPENLLVSADHAKVADFGLARDQENTLMSVGGELGTPSYMAPEVWSHHVSLQSDQYSLAASYVMARLGRPLFKTRLMHELATEHVYSIPNLDPLPREEQKVLLKALAKRPEHRYKTCVEFTNALRKAVLDPPAPRTPIWTTVAVAIGTALLCALVVGAVVMFMLPSPTTSTTATNPTPPPTIITPPPPKEIPEVTIRGWEPNRDAGHKDINGKRYYKELTHHVPGIENAPGETLVALLIEKTHPITDPDPFYILKNKITNRVFESVWKRSNENPNGIVRQFYESHPAQAGQFMLGHWRYGAQATGMGEIKPIEVFGMNIPLWLGIHGKQADVPVLHVTVPEAVLVAQELGGKLPTWWQWQKAVGVMGLRNEQAGIVNLNPQQRAEALSRGDLALGLNDGPWPITRRTADESYWKVHQLLSNGLEWTREKERGGKIDHLFDLPSSQQLVKFVGVEWESPVIKPFSDWHRAYHADWCRTFGHGAGFRIVLEP